VARGASEAHRRLATRAERGGDRLRRLTTLTPKSVRKKLKDRAFAAKVDRGEITAGAELLGVDLSGQIQLIIDALKPHADELGIGPR